MKNRDDTLLVSRSFLRHTNKDCLDQGQAGISQGGMILS